MAIWIGQLTTIPVVILLALLVQHFYLGAKAAQDPPAKRVGDIALPGSCTRFQAEPGSFAAWMRAIPLKSPSSRIVSYDGTRRAFQNGLYQVIDLAIGDKNLQQCADVAIRLRSDYLYSRGQLDDIAFNFTSGDRASYSEWIGGLRPRVTGNTVAWNRTATIDSSYTNYLKYLETVFMYAGSYSLARDLRKVADLLKVKIGDCFIKGGFPGHVMVVVDLAVDSGTGDKYMLLAQGFTPAQSIHIVRNPRHRAISPWYRVGQGKYLVTPEWTFEWSDLYTFDS